jgi:CheY-like chemotaxis protein
MLSEFQAKTNLASDGARDRQANRRSRRRALITLPIRVRRELVGGGQADDISVTLDVSRGGVLFRTYSDDYRPNTAVKVTLPYDSTAERNQPDREGRVLRVKPCADRRFTVAVSFDRAATTPIRGAYAAGLSYAGRPVEDPKRVAIVIDADANIRLSVSHFLRMDGYEVITAKTLLEVEETLKSSTLRLVIAENEGIDFSGHALHALLKGTPSLRNIQLVLLTNSPFANAVSDKSSDPNVVYVTKPFRPQQFREVIRLLSPSNARGSYYGAF